MENLGFPNWGWIRVNLGDFRRIRHMGLKKRRVRGRHIGNEVYCVSPGSHISVSSPIPIEISWHCGSRYVKTGNIGWIFPAWCGGSCKIR